MSRAVAICLLLCATVTGIQALEDVNFTRILDWQTYNPFTVHMGLDLYTLSMSNKSIFINSTDKKFKPCNVIIDPLDDPIYGKVQATVLNGVRKIIVWGAHSVEVIYSTRKMYYKVLMVDPWLCSYNIVNIPDDELSICNEEKPNSYPLLPPQVVRYGNDDFDIFYPTQKICSPCRYDKNRNRLRQGLHHTLGQLKSEIEMPLNYFHIQPLTTVDNQLGYFYAYNFQNNSAVVKYLNKHFHTISEKFVNHTIDVISINEGNYRNVAICYRTYKTLSLPKDQPQEVYCQRLNSKLQSVISVRLPMPEGHFVSNITLKVDGKGNMFVGVIETGQVRVFIYGIYGQFVESFNFGSVDEAKYTYHDLHSILVNNQFCLGVVEQLWYGVHEAHYILKCIEIQKYIGQS